MEKDMNKEHLEKHLSHIQAIKYMNKDSLTSVPKS